MIEDIHFGHDWTFFTPYCGTLPCGMVSSSRGTSGTEVLASTGTEKRIAVAGAEGDDPRAAASASKIAQLPFDATAALPLPLLQDRTDPILNYGEVILYEDELHDHGLCSVTVRWRVMPKFFFILVRCWLRVDGVVVKVSQGRFLHIFGTDELLVETPFFHLFTFSIASY